MKTVEQVFSQVLGKILGKPEEMIEEFSALDGAFLIRSDGVLLNSGTQLTKPTRRGGRWASNVQPAKNCCERVGSGYHCDGRRRLPGCMWRRSAAGKPSTPRCGNPSRTPPKKRGSAVPGKLFGFRFAGVETARNVALAS